MAKKKQKTYFVVTYRDLQEDKVTSLKVEKIGDSSLGLSFIRVSDFIFDNSSLVVNPDEEALEKRLKNTKSMHLSIYSILSIEEIGSSNEGLAFEKDKSNLVVLSGMDKAKPKD